jgi:hypothetical protein
MKVLSEEIKHHVKEEERPGEGVFAQARDGGLDMDVLGDRLAHARNNCWPSSRPTACRRRRRAPSRATG